MNLRRPDFQSGALPTELRFRGMNEGSRTPNRLIRNQLLYPIELHSYVAGAVGFEPTNGGVRDRCLTAWLHPNIEDGDACGN